MLWKALEARLERSRNSRRTFLFLLREDSSFSFLLRNWCFMEFMCVWFGTLEPLFLGESVGQANSMCTFLHTFSVCFRFPSCRVAGRGDKILAQSSLFSSAITLFYILTKRTNPTIKLISLKSDSFKQRERNHRGPGRLHQIRVFHRRRSRFRERQQRRRKARYEQYRSRVSRVLGSHIPECGWRRRSELRGLSHLFVDFSKMAQKLKNPPEKSWR